MKPICTFGYYGFAPEDLARIVANLDAKLIDIRYSPRSRNPGWNGVALQRLLNGAYLHDPNLGNENYKNGGPIKLHAPDLSIGSIRNILAVRPVILLCVCPNVEKCHRKPAAEYLARHIIGADIIHLEGRRFCR